MVPKIDTTHNYVVLHLKGRHSQGITKIVSKVFHVYMSNFLDLPKF